MLHAAIRELQIINGETPAPEWADAPQWMRQASAGSYCAAAAGRTGRVEHERWMAAKLADGWVHGPVKDPAAIPPAHPDLVPYEQLPEPARRKDMLAAAVAAALAGPLT